MVGVLECGGVLLRLRRVATSELQEIKSWGRVEAAKGVDPSSRFFRSCSSRSSASNQSSSLYPTLFSHRCCPISARSLSLSKPQGVATRGP